jgi:uncharacterized protein (TIGR02246 family)
MMASMRPALAYLTMLLCLGSAVAVPASSNDEDAIRGTVSKYLSARNEKAPDRVRNLFTTDADQLVSTGEWRHGVDELVRGMMASSSKEQAKSSISISDVRLIDSNVAIADGRYRTTSLDGTARDMWTTFVIKRTSDGWRIAAIRNMKPAPNQQSK